ncbi:hypothetical protein DRA42_10050 [Ethanoligenens harbinense]|nr:hypothetical protein CXQ68_10020 [Ethanoligenens harbinense YUAN-3]AYF39193.1 hypothetical protein CXP51_09910 [Ethanoligenens harbinense]AYF42016.1 hypothetical protein CN246_10460 [Ethanoligenens harbinense]QCN92771.1 hypothetical protein DRA42_10050 [Ethanoligenens harbinense]
MKRPYPAKHRFLYPLIVLAQSVIHSTIVKACAQKSIAFSAEPHILRIPRKHAIMKKLAVAFCADAYAVNRKRAARA